MRFLVHMKVADTARPPFHAELQDAVTFIEASVIPTMMILGKLASEQKVVGGGPLGGEIEIVFIIEAESVLEIDELLEGLPLWPRMVTTVTPMTTFENRIKSLSLKVAGIKTLMQGGKVGG